MTFRRKIYNALLSWKKQNGKTALLIEGARRVGKSTIAEEFAKREYKSYLLIDFNNVSDNVLSIFENYSNHPNDFFLLLSAEYNKILYPRESLIIFDEVQQYPRARQLVKYFVQDGRYDFLETGSLINIKENVQNITIPSEEDKLKMYPMDFEEFAWALGEESLIELIKTRFNEKKPLDAGMHRRAMYLFKQYMLVGGMPQSVDAFISNQKSFEAADSAKRGIINLYKDDIRKIDRRYRARVSAIFEQIPGMLSKHDKRVILSSIPGNGNGEDYQESFFWLSDSMITNDCFKVNDPNIGMAITQDDAYVKCYMGDTGLLVSHAFNEKELYSEEIYKKILNDKLSINEGMLFENVVAQMLVAAGYELFYYTRYNREKHRNDIEIDFIITNGSNINPKIYPVEIKPSKKYSTSSLDRFQDVFHRRIGTSYVIHPKEFSIEEDRMFLPAYMTFCL